MRQRARQARNYVFGEGLGPLLVRAVAGSSVVQVAGMLVTFAVGVLLARGLGVEGYGYYGIAMAVVALASVPGEYGLAKLVTREVAAASAHDDWPRMFGVLRWADRVALWIAAIIAIAMAILALLGVARPSSPVVFAILVGAPVVPLIALARIRGAALQGLHYLVLGQIPFNLVRPLLFALLLAALFYRWPEAGAAEAMALNTLTAAAALALAAYWLRSRMPAVRPAELVEAGRRWLASCIPMALADGMRILYLQLAILLLGLIASAAEVGLFRIAASTIVMVAVPVTLMNRVIAPVLAKLYAQGDFSRLQHLCTRSAQAMAAAVLALTLPIVLWGSPLLAFIFGDEYAPAYTALVLLCAGQLVNAGFGANANLLTMTGFEKRVTRAMLIALGVNLVLAATLIPPLGNVGAAAALVGSMVCWNLLTWLDARRFVGIQTSLVPSRRDAFPPQAG